MSGADGVEAFICMTIERLERENPDNDMGGVRNWSAQRVKRIRELVASGDTGLAIFEAFGLGMNVGDFRGFVRAAHEAALKGVEIADKATPDNFKLGLENGEPVYRQKRKRHSTRLEQVRKSLQDEPGISKSEMARRLDMDRKDLRKLIKRIESGD
ncbi:hypothetical protein [Sansalvadorimonas verongulae]|uniref:hypothetical protein n=1 Tax=Sansalvadorimonas verongulae TaxID=2172824 RepID=UPI0012BCBBB3|nr:hypothetical protein [Sansalvadorimonas verongulae]MTI13243.1 hypothetical protein [Sansalvadorimonas verongulae]